MSPRGSSSGSGGVARPVTRTPAIEGALLGPYKVLRIVAEGGMGIVYEAEHTLIGRRAAIKVLAGDAAQDEESVSRFFTEARAVNQIRHPNIVAVTDFGTHDGRHYIVMEHLEGETLAERVERQSVLPPLQAVHMTRQVASALGAAHDAGLVHRDLKPANIFLCQHMDYPDFVKVLDFGIAKLVKSEVPVGFQTKVGALLGTPAYMSPEQCLGEPGLDHRSDIYSLGVVLYLMLTGQLPFEDNSLGRLILSHVNIAPRPPWAVNSTVSEALSNVVMKALEKRPSDRYPTMREFRRALDEAIRPETEWAAAAAKSGQAPFTQMMTSYDSSEQIFVGRNTPSRGFNPGTLAYTLNSRPQTPPSDPQDALVQFLTQRVAERISSQAFPLPDLPPFVATCLGRLRLPGLSVGPLAAFLSADPRISDRLVHLARNGAYGSRGKIDSIEDAIRLLGPTGLQQALIEMLARPVIESSEPRVRALFHEPWKHAIATALVAERLTIAIGQPELVAPAYLGGLLHDAGRPLVATFLLGLEKERVDKHGPGWMPEDVRRRVIEATFRNVSVTLASKWMVPSRAQLAIERSGELSRENRRSLAAVLGLALAVATREGFPLNPSDGDDIDALVLLGRGSLGLEESSLLRITADLRERVALLAQLRGS